MNENTTLKDIREAKKALESKISSLLCTFSYEYDVECEVGIDPRLVKAEGIGNVGYSYSTKVNIKL